MSKSTKELPDDNPEESWLSKLTKDLPPAHVAMCADCRPWKDKTEAEHDAAIEDLYVLVADICELCREPEPDIRGAVLKLVFEFQR